VLERHRTYIAGELRPGISAPHVTTSNTRVSMKDADGLVSCVANAQSSMLYADGWV
jgi:hypothetical protein